MPELPEVETIVRDLNKSLRHKKFEKVHVIDAFVLRQPHQDFIRRLESQGISGITRRGKAIIMQLTSSEFLVVQLMMTGQLIVGGKPDRHTRIAFDLLDGGNLLYNDQRRFGQLRVVAGLDQVKHFNALGPEPLSKDFTPMGIFEGLRKSTRPIKNVLLDHTVVAGIGNIYACEILFRSRIDPRRHAGRLTLKECETIHAMSVEVLKEAIAHRGSSMRNYRDGQGKKGRFNERLAVYAREGLPCPRCQQLVLRLVQAGRSTFYCGHCQK